MGATGRRIVSFGIPVFLAVLLISHTGAGLVVQFLIGKLAYSTSNGAALFLLLTVSLGLAVGEFAVIPGRYADWLNRYLLLALLSGYGLHAWATFKYLYQFQLPFGPYFLHWRDGANSYTSPFHSHLGKAAISYGAELLGVDSTQTSYDMGGVFRDVVGDPFLAILGFCFLSGLITLVTAFQGIRERYSGFPALPAIFLGSGAVALKNLLDGGLLAQPSALALACLIMLMAARNVDDLKIKLRRYRWALVTALVGVQVPSAIWSGDGPLPNQTEFLSALAFVSLMLNALLGSHRRWIGPLAGFYLLLVVTIDARFNLLPILRSIPKDTEVWRVDQLQAMEIPDELMSAHRLYRHFDNSPQKPHWLLIGDRGSTGSRRIQTFILPIRLSGQLGRFQPEPAFAGLQVRPVPNQPGWLLVLADIRRELPPAYVDTVGDSFSKNNTYVYTHSLARMLKNAGFDEYVMMPVTSGNAIPLSYLSSND